MASIACRPCSAALRIRPMPPSSPAMKMPGTLVSNCGLTCGMSTPRRSVPKTSRIASTGQAARQAPWPMQAARVDQHRLARHHAQRLLRAGLRAGARADAAQRVDHRVQRHRLGHARGWASRSAATCAAGATAFCGRRRRPRPRPAPGRRAKESSRLHNACDLDAQVGAAQVHHGRLADQVAGLGQCLPALADARAHHHLALAGEFQRR